MNKLFKVASLLPFFVAPLFAHVNVASYKSYVDSLLPNPVIEMMYILNLTDRRNDVFCTKVRKTDGRQELANLVMALEVHVFDLEAFLMAQGVEVLDREQADVRRIVPFVGEFLRNRHAAVKHQASASRPVTEIRECHDDLLCDAQ